MSDNESDNESDNGTGIQKSNQRYQSDIIVDMIKRFEIPFIALNPGASYRGLHDSLVNYGEDQPPMILCNHEEIAVAVVVKISPLDVRRRATRERLGVFGQQTRSVVVVYPRYPAVDQIEA